MSSPLYPDQSVSDQHLSRLRRWTTSQAFSLSLTQFHYPTHQHRRSKHTKRVPSMRRLNGTAVAVDNKNDTMVDNDGPLVLCVQCDRPIMRNYTSSTGAQRSPPLHSPSLCPPHSTHAPTSISHASARDQQRSPSTHPSTTTPSLLPSLPSSNPSSASFVMVTRMADMSMSFLHVQEAAAAAISSPSSFTSRPSSFPSSSSSSSYSSHTGLSEHLRRAEFILQYGAGQVDVNSPACSHCMDVMEQALDKELAHLAEEEARYTSVIAHHSTTCPPSLPPSLTSTRAVMEDAVQRLHEKCEVSRGEEEGLREGLARLMKEEAAVAREARAFWRALCAHEEGGREGEEGREDVWRDIAKIHARVTSLEAPENALLRVLLEGGGRGGGREGGGRGVWDDIFVERGGGKEGGRVGGLGGENIYTINGFRLARREVPRIDLWWSEINAAWGQVVLIVNAVAHVVGFQEGGREEEGEGGWERGKGRYRAVYVGAASRLVQDQGRKNQLAFPLFVVGGGGRGGRKLRGGGGEGKEGKQQQQHYGRLEEGVRRLCLLVSEVQKFVLAGDEEGRELVMEKEERLYMLDLTKTGLRDETAWNTAVQRLVAALGWLVRAACVGRRG